MSELTQEKFDALKATHGDIAAVRIAGETFVLRIPTRAEFRRCMDRSGDNNSKNTDALEELAAVCSVFPEKAEREEIFRRRPGIPIKLGNKALALAGIEEVEDVKI